VEVKVKSGGEVGWSGNRGVDKAKLKVEMRNGGEGKDEN
jgi:hypothetical protein